MAQLICTALPGLPLVEPGDDLAALIAGGLEAAGIVAQDGDILVIAQKIVSKAQGRYVDLSTITPGPEALVLAEQVLRDPRLVEVILAESNAVVKSAPNLLVVEHRLGLVMANAGIDQSNIHHEHDLDRVLLLPLDPDGAAEELRENLATLTGARMGVVIADSFGRPWRLGVTGVAIGAAGVPALIDMVGEPDLFGRALQVTELGVGDELAATASLVMGQAAEGCPVAHIRGVSWDAPERPAAALIRPREQDRFR
jgi:coenzyme F420-0:L-glutamate ligase / coenzyme F420-1:gamma-L-glutamate ligase